ncbi:MAG: zinc ribbon domain-containing protein, partial [Methanobrevibacter sp.]|nr:zinc ribbon domain-containing protein [Methanobrevibacter sp.]
CPECGFEQHNDDNRYCSNCGFDFSKLENNIKSEEDDNSSVIVHIDSEEDSVSKTASSAYSKAIKSGPTVSSASSTTKSSSSSSTKNSAGSSAKTTKTYTSKSSNNDFLSKLTFNKCFLAFAVLLIILLIIGMFAQLDPEPHSDHGLTSFMERSNSYSYSDFIEDSNNYYDDSDYDYLSYDEDNDYASLVEN